MNNWTLTFRVEARQTFETDFTKKNRPFLVRSHFFPSASITKIFLAFVLECKLNPNPNFHLDSFIPSLRKPPLEKIKKISPCFQERTNISRTTGDRKFVRVSGRSQGNEQSETGRTFYGDTAILARRKKSPDFEEPPCRQIWPDWWEQSPHSIY